jgi:hypothetical protein
MPALATQQYIPGQVPILWNHTFVLTIENFSIKASQSSDVATGFAGNFATRDGVPQYSFTFDMPPTAAGFEVDLSVLKTRGTLTYRIGAQEFTLNGAKVNEDDLSVAMKAGTTTCRMSGNALSRTPA